MRSVPDRGLTLVELLVVLALLGLVLGVSGLAFASLGEPAAAADAAAFARARAEAIQRGEPVRLDSLLFLPDGRVVGSGLDPLTGGTRAP